MAMNHLNRWIAGDGKKLTNLQKITLRLAVIAEVKESRPTVRAKRSVQQRNSEIPSCFECMENGVDCYSSVGRGSKGCAKLRLERSLIA
jgi:hypothetical protein